MLRQGPKRGLWICVLGSLETRGGSVWSPTGLLWLGCVMASVTLNSCSMVLSQANVLSFPTHYSLRREMEGKSSWCCWEDDRKQPALSRESEWRHREGMMWSEDRWWPWSLSGKRQALSSLFSFSPWPHWAPATSTRACRWPIRKWGLNYVFVVDRSEIITTIYKLFIEEMFFKL